ncbi:MAG: DMT family transporter, partial [Myxococcota bacterium]
SVLFALLILSYRRLSPDEGIAAVTAGNFMIAIGCLPWAIAGPSPTVADGLVIAYLGVFQQACGHLLFIWGMSAVSALEGALLILIEPIASPGWAYLTVQERPGPWFALGASIVILAQIGRIVSSQRSSGAEKTTPSDDTDGLNGMND